MRDDTPASSATRGVPVLEGEDSPGGFTTTDRLLDLGLAGATRAEQEAGVADWLASNEPCETLRSDLREDDFTLWSGDLPSPPAASPG
jgi:hypothetical protein